MCITPAGIGEILTIDLLYAPARLQKKYYYYLIKSQRTRRNLCKGIQLEAQKRAGKLPALFSWFGR